MFDSISHVKVCLKKKWLIGRTKKGILFYGVVSYSLLPFPGRCNDVPPDSSDYTFDSALSISHYKSIDLKRLSKDNALLPGKYDLDVYLNNERIAQKSFDLKADKDGVGYFCLKPDILSLLDINRSRPEYIQAEKKHQSDDCTKIGELVAGATYNIDVAKQRIDFVIPQYYLNHRLKGEIPQSQWDRGMSAAKMTYHLNAIDSYRKKRSNEIAAFLDSNIGVNIFGWQLSQDVSIEKDAGDSSHLKHANTYVESAVPALLAKIQIGDITTADTVMDNVNIRGVRLSSDEQMLPSVLRSFAPTVHGVARTSALIEVKQNDSIVYRTYVAPGEFSIDDLPSSISNGSLDVVINEADGTKRHIIVPVGVSNNLLRPGQQRFSLSMGKLHEDGSTAASVVQGSYLYGISNVVSAHVGGILSGKYHSELLGGSLLSPIGIFSIDVSRSQYSDISVDVAGYSYKASYLVDLDAAKTHLSLSMQKNDRKYISLHDISSQLGSEELLGNQQYEYQAIITQPISETAGSFYFSGIADKYFGERKMNVQYQIGYSNSFHGVSYSLNFSREYRHADNGNRSENKLNANIVIPFTIGEHHITTTSSIDYGRQYSSSSIGIDSDSGENNNLNLHADMTNLADGSNSATFSGQYISPYSTLSGSYSYNPLYQQVALSAEGGMVLHSKGVTLSPYRIGDTAILVESPGAGGAAVNNQRGIVIDKNGYAIIPSASPYAMNTVTLDTTNMANNVELTNNQKSAVPYADSIVKLHFDTLQGTSIFIHAVTAAAQPLPLGATVFDDKGDSVGMVSQGSNIYAHVVNTAGRLKVEWGDKKSETCFVDYQIPAEADMEDVIRLQGSCHE